MKIKSNYLFALLLMLIVAGCSKQQPYVAPPLDPLTNPQGSFIGMFTLIHLNPATKKLDTASAIITLAMQTSVTAGNTFSVGGDTTKIQAASHGTFSADGGIITFADATVTKLTSPNAPKKHLQGPFIYTYDGNNLHIYGSSDTLNFNYVFVGH